MADGASASTLHTASNTLHSGSPVNGCAVLRSRSGLSGDSGRSLRLRSLIRPVDIPCRPVRPPSTPPRSVLEAIFIPSLRLGGVCCALTGRAEVPGFFRALASGLAAGLPHVPVLLAGGLDHGGDRDRPGRSLEEDHLNASPDEVGKQRLGPGVAGGPSPGWQLRGPPVRQWRGRA